MRVIYSDQKITGLENEFSIFLVGPSPRKSGIVSWRIEALQILERLKFEGVVLVPERSNKEAQFDYDDQVDWEDEGLQGVNLIVCWVPRQLPLLMGLTTNFEIGRYLDSGRLIYGRPNDADKIRYLDKMYQKVVGQDPFETLESLLARAVLEKTLRK